MPKAGLRGPIFGKSSPITKRLNVENGLNNDTMKTTRFYTLLALLLMAGRVMAQNTCWDGTVAEAYADGDGTPENPYQIATAEDGVFRPIGNGKS